MNQFFQTHWEQTPLGSARLSRSPGSYPGLVVDYPSLQVVTSIPVFDCSMLSDPIKVPPQIEIAWT